MTEHKTLTAALAAVQAELPEVGKTKVADTGSYSYRYADLADIAKALFPVLSKHGLAFIATPTYNEEGNYVLYGQLEFANGDGYDARRAVFPLNDKASPQQIGSAITYGRRYLLCSLTGLVADEDDDGKAASEPTERPKQVRRRRTATTPLVHEPQEPSPEWDDFSKQESADEPPSEEMITEAQRSKLFLLFNAHGIKNRDERLAFASGLIKRDIASLNELTKVEASKLIDHLEHLLKQEPS